VPDVERLLLVSAADDGYALPLAVALYSALVHLGSDVEPVVYVIDGGISERHRCALQGTVAAARSDTRINWHRLDPSIDHLRVGRHFTPTTYARLAVADAVPDTFKKAIYLDSDVQVEADLSELWEAPFDRHALLAVQDCLVPYASSPGGPPHVRGPQHATRPYFNAGVLVMDLQRWRDEQTSARVLSYLQVHGDDLVFMDQDALNAVLGGDTGLLDPKWNVPTSLLWLDRWPESPFKERMRGLKDRLLLRPAISHFIGPVKPWHGHFHDLAGARWHHYREGAGWPPPSVDPTIDDLDVWLEEQRRDDLEIASVVPHDTTLILVGESCRLPVSVCGRRALPFPERNGVFRGNPVDDATAIAELGRMREQGSRFIVFDRSAHWWLDHYRGFARHLRSSHVCVLESPRLMIFELGTAHG